MKNLTKSELKNINGGSETLKRFGAWLSEQYCKAKSRHETYLAYKEEVNWL